MKSLKRMKNIKDEQILNMLDDFINSIIDLYLIFNGDVYPGCVYDVYDYDEYIDELVGKIKDKIYEGRKKVKERTGKNNR